MLAAGLLMLTPRPGFADTTVLGPMFVHDTSGKRTRAAFEELCAGLKATRPFECWDLFETGFVGVPKHGFSEADVAEKIGMVEVGNDILQDSNRGVLHMEETMPFAPRIAPRGCSISSVHRQALPEPAEDMRPGVVNSSTLAMQTNAPYHLAFLHDRWQRMCTDRNGTMACPPLGSFAAPNSAEHTTIYVLGTNINSAHMDLAGRVSDYRFLIDEEDPCECTKWQGTHAAALSAGLIHGVAKGAFVVPVVVKPGCHDDLTVRHVVRGLQWVVETRRSGRQSGPAVLLSTVHVNAQRNDTVAIRMMEDLLKVLADMNVTVVAAAQSMSADECLVSPGRMPGAITVGGAEVYVDDDNQFGARPWPISNYGECVDIWAQSSMLESAFSPDFDSTSVYSGTVHAAALVAGVAALVAEDLPNLGPEEVRRELMKMASRDLIANEPVLQAPWDFSLDM